MIISINLLKIQIMKLPQYVYLLFFFLYHYLHPILSFLISIKIFNQNNMTNNVYKLYFSIVNLPYCPHHYCSHHH